MTDLLLKAWMALLIEWTRVDHARGKGRRWRPGEPLRLLLCGYNGARNTGSDVRVEEMVRQIRHVVGKDRISVSVLTQDPELTQGYFQSAPQVKLADIFPPFLAREVPYHDGVIACEGSMFKSGFADALSTMMVGALGIAAARNGLSVGYGGEAGAMSPSLARLVRRYCGSSLVIARNEESQQVLRGLGVPSEPGTDTAWTFVPPEPEVGRTLLARLGWDGDATVLGICPVHPSHWPVAASVGKALACKLTGAFADSRYRGIYFHRSGAEVRERYERYLEALAGAVKSFSREHRVFPVIVGMERLDADPCRRLSALLDGAPVLDSADRDMWELVSVLRNTDLLVSSRYHAILTSMSALVPSAGIATDERIRNLMEDRGHAELCLEATDPDLEDRLYDAMSQLLLDREAFAPDLGRCVARNLRRMARMGLYLERELAARFEGFQGRQGLVSWERYLPPLDPSLRALLKEHDPQPETAPAPR